MYYSIWSCLITYKILYHILLYEYSLTYSVLINECLGCFQYFGISSKATLSNSVHRTFCLDGSRLKGKFPQMELLSL